MVVVLGDVPFRIDRRELLTAIVPLDLGDDRLSGRAPTLM
jgi:hypothetical protein